MQIIPLKYAPDEDTAWLANPGAVATLNGLAPTKRGTYATVGAGYWIGNSTSITGTDFYHAQLFRGVAGAVRFLIFRKQNIDEYNSSATRTNQGTGYSASTADWTAAGFGDNIIATNYLDVVQVSTGSTFGALSGSPPKAKLVAANDLFVMLANYDDGTAIADGWWCSAIGNPTSWTASAATQAANGRIWGPPGPIRALVAFKKSFVAFKDNSVHILQYVGPPNIWTVSTISDRIGCPSPHGVTQLGDKLYWYHASSFYSFDGSNIVDIGKPVIKAFNVLVNYTGTTTGANGPRKVQAVADDFDRMVLFATTAASGGLVYQTTYCLNVDTGHWGVWDHEGGGTGTGLCYVAGTSADMADFVSKPTARFALVRPNSTSGMVRYFGFPLDPGSGSVTMTINGIGNYDQAGTVNGVRIRVDSSSIISTASATYTTLAHDTASVASSGPTDGVYNSESGLFHLTGNGKLGYLSISAVDVAEIYGIGLQYAEKQPGKR